MFTGNLCHRLRPTVRLAVVQTLRQGHTMRGKPAGEARTLAQRLRGKRSRGGQISDTLWHTVGPVLRIQCPLFVAHNIYRRQSGRCGADAEGGHWLSAAAAAALAADQRAAGAREGAAHQCGAGEAGTRSHTYVDRIRHRQLATNGASEITGFSDTAKNSISRFSH